MCELYGCQSRRTMLFDYTFPNTVCFLYTLLRTCSVSTYISLVRPSRDMRTIVCAAASNSAEDFFSGSYEYRLIRVGVFESNTTSSTMTI